MQKNDVALAELARRERLLPDSMRLYYRVSEPQREALNVVRARNGLPEILHAWTEKVLHDMQDGTRSLGQVTFATRSSHIMYWEWMLVGVENQLSGTVWARPTARSRRSLTEELFERWQGALERCPPYEQLAPVLEALWLTVRTEPQQALVLSKVLFKACAELLAPSLEFVGAVPVDAKLGWRFELGEWRTT